MPSVAGFSGRNQYAPITDSPTLTPGTCAPFLIESNGVEPTKVLRQATEPENATGWRRWFGDVPFGYPSTHFIRGSSRSCAGTGLDSKLRGTQPTMFVGQLIVFAKAPRPGFVKSRLARDLGPDHACAAYLEIVDTLLGNLTPIANVEIRVEPDVAPLNTLFSRFGPDSQITAEALNGSIVLNGTARNAADTDIRNQDASCPNFA